MANEIKIPSAALEAGAIATLEELDAIAGLIGATRVEGELTPEQQEFFRRIARATFLAMVKAWPEAMFANFPEDDKVRVELILPLTEKPDE